jgi:hypothetical protein
VRVTGERRRVVGVGVGERRSRQETVIRGRPGQPPQVVVSERVGARGIGHLLNLAHQVAHIRRARRVGIALLRQPIERVVHILNRLALAIRFAGQVAMPS